VWRCLDNTPSATVYERDENTLPTPVGTRLIYVDKFAAPSTQNGGVLTPYHTIQAALDAIGAAASVPDFNDADKSPINWP